MDRQDMAPQQGFVLLAFTLAIVFLLGIAGLAVDLGRMYVVNNELQTPVDAAALAGAIQLDGTAEGVQRALDAVAANPKRWEFGTHAVAGEQALFASSGGGPWIAAAALPSPPSDYFCVRVSAAVILPMYFLPLVAQAGSSTISAAAVAGRLSKTTFEEGIFPFSPFSHKIDGVCVACDDTHDAFGMRQGEQYTLRWASTPKAGKGTVCPGDASQKMINLAQAGGGTSRGYIQLNSTADITRAIVSTEPCDLAITGSVVMAGGEKSGIIFQALPERVRQDSDAVSSTYAEYKSGGLGNGRRVVVVPINNGFPGFHVLGFAGFFLLPPSSYQDTKGSSPACAEYIGPWLQGARTPGGGPAGAYVVRLLE